jgi:hypothetical protein
VKLHVDLICSIHKKQGIPSLHRAIEFESQLPVQERILLLQIGVMLYRQLRTAIVADNAKNHNRLV